MFVVHFISSKPFLAVQMKKYIKCRINNYAYDYIKRNLFSQMASLHYNKSHDSQSNNVKMLKTDLYSAIKSEDTEALLSN